MAHGLEVRVPYLDREIVEYVERLPANFKVRGLTQKWLHRQVCQAYLPKEILQRKKRGFAVNVVDDWFRASMNTNMTETLLDEHSLLYEFLEPAVVSRMLKQHQSGERDYHKVLFSLVVFDQWLKVQVAPGSWFDRSPVSLSPAGA
jgi:asparagine synthase (glutamine-hydrolysing)